MSDFLFFSLCMAAFVCFMIYLVYKEDKEKKQHPEEEKTADEVPFFSKLTEEEQQEVLRNAEESGDWLLLQMESDWF